MGTVEEVLGATTGLMAIGVTANVASNILGRSRQKQKRRRGKPIW